MIAIIIQLVALWLWLAQTVPVILMITVIPIMIIHWELALCQETAFLVVLAIPRALPMLHAPWPLQGLSVAIQSAQCLTERIVACQAKLWRLPSNNCYYRCVEDHFEIFVRIYDQQFERQYGFCDYILSRSFTGIWTAAICTDFVINAGYER